MKTIKEYQIDFKSVDLTKQVEEFFEYYDKRDIFIHSLNVANEAKSLAARLNESEEKAYIAGLLHDIGVVIPKEDRVPLQKQMGMELLKEEEMLPMILHQKQSVVISKEIFNIEDTEILSAIECHTTLRKNASVMDKIVFIADKISWDGNDSAPYLSELEIALNDSLDEACRVYSRWSLSDIVVLHPWFKEAMEDLGCN